MLDTNLIWNDLIQLSLQILIVIALVTYLNNYLIHPSRVSFINQLWIIIFVIYLDWLLWQNCYSTIIFGLVLLIILLVYYQKYNQHDQILQSLYQNWQQYLWY